MAVLKSTEISKMSRKEMTAKIKELKVELIKARVALKKGGKSNLREIKKAIARLLTAMKSNKTAKETKTNKK